MSGHEMVEKPIAMKKWELCQIPLQNLAVEQGFTAP